MRLPFPKRIPFHGAVIFAAALFVVQWMEGTPVYFCAGSMLFILIATLAFNTAGGLTRSSGVYVFFYSLLVVVIGLTYKALLGERADSNLADPHTTIEVYVAGIAAMFVAAFLSRRFARKAALLENLLKEPQMYQSAVGCILAGVLVPFALDLLGPSVQPIGSIFLQLNELMPLGIIIAVIYEVRRSDGYRSLNLFAIAAIAYYFVFYGIFGFSKQGMLAPLFAWFIAAWSQRYRFTRAQMLGGLVMLWVIFRYLTPYAQYGRGFVDAGMGVQDRASVVVRLLEDPEQTRTDYNDVMGDARGLNSYYDSPQGFWDRLQFISVDDALINVTDQGKVFGLLPLKAEALNAIPHIFWPDKPAVNFGNMYAHEIGGFSDEDTTTGISFSPTGEAYHLAKWIGVLVIAPLLWTVLFTLYDSLFGDLRRTPWGLLAAFLISHVAPEGGITGVIHMITFGTEIFVFCALFATWVAPLIAAGLPGFVPRRNIVEAAA